MKNSSTFQSLVGATALLSLLASSSAAWAGSASSGGGTTVRDSRNGRMVLLDFVIENPSFDSAANDPVDPSGRIDATTFSMTLGYDRIQARQAPGYLLATERLRAWQASSPVVTALIRSALESMDWVFTPYRQEICAVDKLPGGIARESLESAVVYTENFGARMSLPVVNQLGRASRAGLLIHEALRHIAIAYQDGLTDETLRRVTAKIILSDPVPGETLDHSAWYGGMVASLINAEQSRQELLRSVCTVLKKSEEPKIALCTEGNATQEKSEPKVYIEKLLTLSDEMSDIILRMKTSNSEDRAEFVRIVNLRDGLTNVINEVLAGRFAATIPATVDASHQLNHVFLNLTEDGLRRYLNGDRSEFGFFENLKIKNAVKEAQTANQKALDNGMILSCTSKSN